MPIPLPSKIDAEHRLREFLRAHGLPQPDGVEYGYACVRFFFREPKVCLVFDLNDDAEALPDRDAASGR